MIRINLIPYRVAFRQQQIIEHISIFVAALLIAILLIVTVDVWSSKELSDLQDEQKGLQAQNAALSKKIGELRNLDALRRDVEGKLQIVDELQSGRFKSLNTFNAIAEAIPENIWITRLTDQPGQLILTGYGESSKAVANFMRAIEQREEFENVNLTVDKQAIAEGVEVRQFGLSFHRLSLKEKTEQAAKKGALK